MLRCEPLFAAPPFQSGIHSTPDGTTEGHTGRSFMRSDRNIGDFEIGVEPFGGITEGMAPSSPRIPSCSNPFYSICKSQVVTTGSRNG